MMIQNRFFFFRFAEKSKEFNKLHLNLKKQDYSNKESNQYIEQFFN